MVRWKSVRSFSRYVISLLSLFYVLIRNIHILLCNRANLGIFPIHNQLSIHQITADTKRKGPAGKEFVRISQIHTSDRQQIYLRKRGEDIFDIMRPHRPDREYFNQLGSGLTGPQYFGRGQCSGNGKPGIAAAPVSYTHLIILRNRSA